MKKILFINQRAPHGSCYAREQLQMAMVFGAFEHKVSLLFKQDGLFCLLKSQQVDQIGFVDFSKTYLSLSKYYDIEDVYIDRESLKTRNLSLQDFVIPVKLINQTELKELLLIQDIVLSI